MQNSEILVGEIPVSTYRTMDEAVAAVFSHLDGAAHPGFAIAINPEKVICAQSDMTVRDALLSATLRFADGIGVVWALRSKGAKQAVRIPGCELWEALMKEAGRLKQPVFLVGARAEVLNQVRKKLADQFDVSVVGMQDGYYSVSQQNDLIHRIKESGATLVTVAMGSPRQELFIECCRQAYPNAFYMGVGGTYDVFTGNVKRAPEWACKMNIEWLYRLVSNPSRLGRQVVLLKYLMLLVFRKL